jgi:hypothetical protein
MTYSDTAFHRERDNRVHRNTAHVSAPGNTLTNTANGTLLVIGFGARIA